MCDTAVPRAYFADQPRNFKGRSGGVRLLWVGRTLTRKALPLALDALKQVHENITLTIAGEGVNGSNAIHQMIRDRDLQSRVFWKGSRLNYQELRTAYAEHDAMLFTSLRDSFGSQLLEAMAMGLPIITLDLHGAHDHVPSSASIKVPVGRPEETIYDLVNAIEEYSSYPLEKKAEMSRQAWNFAKTLSWSGRAEATEKLYEKVIETVTPVRKSSEMGGREQLKSSAPVA